MGDTGYASMWLSRYLSMGACTLALRFSGDTTSQVLLVWATIQLGDERKPRKQSLSCVRGDTLENEAHSFTAKHLKGACVCHLNADTYVWDLDAFLGSWR